MHREIALPGEGEEGFDEPLYAVAPARSGRRGVFQDHSVRPEVSQELLELGDGARMLFALYAGDSPCHEAEGFFEDGIAEAFSDGIDRDDAGRIVLHVVNVGWFEATIGIGESASSRPGADLRKAYSKGVRSDKARHDGFSGYRRARDKKGGEKFRLGKRNT